MIYTGQRYNTLVAFQTPAACYFDLAFGNNEHSRAYWDLGTSLWRGVGELVQRGEEGTMLRTGGHI